MGTLIAEHVMARVAGLPFTVVERMHGGEAAAVAAEIDAIHAALEAQREGLCERLYQATGGESDSTLRRALLSAKRSVFNGRPGDPPPACDAALSEELTWWNANVARLDELEAEGAEAVQRDLERTRAVLGELWNNDALQNGILFAQPELYRELASPRGWSGRSPHVRRKLERAALAYCRRMATKTSPFSTFTTTGYALLDGAAPAPRQETFTLNAGLLDALVDALVSSPRFRNALPLRAARALRSEGKEVFAIVSRGGGSVARAESIVSVPRTALVEAVLAVANTKSLPTTAAALGKLLAANAPTEALQERLQSMIGNLIDSGIVAPSLSYEANDAHALHALANASELRGTDVAARLTDVDAAIRALETQPPAARASTIAEVHRDVTALFASVSDEPRPLREQALVHHAVHHGTKLPFTRDELEPLRTACGALHHLLPLFNARYAYQQLVRDLFVEMAGNVGLCDSVLTFYRDAHELLRRGDDGDPIEAAAESHAAAAQQESAMRALVTDLRLLASVSDAPVPVPRWTIARHAGQACTFAPRLAPSSAGLLGHFIREEHELRFVLNQVVPGYGAMWGRAAAEGAPAHAIDSLRRTLASLREDAETVDLAGTFGFDAQIRGPLAARRLTYPGEAVRDDARQIAWNDVRLVWDDERELPMLTDRLGTKLLPLHGGTLSRLFHPAFFRFLTAFGPAFEPQLPLVDLFEDGLSDERRRTTRHYARLTLGALVLLRETWCVPAADVPVRSASSGDFGDFHRLRRWARYHGLPRRVFVTPMRTGEFLRRDVAAEEFRRLHKPFYVDWDDVATVQAFRYFTAASRETITISEMLPTPEQLLVRNGGAPHVVEHLIELYDSPAGGIA